MGWHGSAPLRPTLTPMRLWWRLLLWVVFALWGVVLIRLDHRTGEIFTSFLHRPLLIFHEAGHVLFIPLGDWMAVAGGSLMQLIVPAVLAGALLLKNHDRFGASIGVWFFGVSLLDLAPYIYDALVPQLTLLNGETGEAGGHDWIFLLSSMGWLASFSRNCQYSSTARGMITLMSPLLTWVISGCAPMFWPATNLVGPYGMIDRKSVV